MISPSDFPSFLLLLSKIASDCMVEEVWFKWLQEFIEKGVLIVTGTFRSHTGYGIWVTCLVWTVADEHPWFYLALSGVNYDRLGLTYSYSLWSWSLISGREAQTVNSFPSDLGSCPYACVFRADRNLWGDWIITRETRSSAPQSPVWLPVSMSLYHLGSFFFSGISLQAYTPLLGPQGKQEASPCVLQLPISQWTLPKYLSVPK